MPLDFANTLDNRGQGPEREKELLQSYADLVAFLQQSNMISDPLARKLNARALREPRTASAILARTRTFREAMNRVIADIATGRDPDSHDLALVNAEITSAAAHTRLIKTASSFEWTWAGEPDSLERPLWIVVRATTDLLISGHLDRVRLCEDEKCRWAFLDTSRNRTRRWCDMKICGNRAKVRRFYQKQKEA
jgi:predicted RNA-binding Zn ribbon-like protein